MYLIKISTYPDLNSEKIIKFPSNITDAVKDEQISACSITYTDWSHKQELILTVTRTSPALINIDLL